MKGVVQEFEHENNGGTTVLCASWVDYNASLLKQSLVVVTMCRRVMKYYCQLLDFWCLGYRIPELDLVFMTVDTRSRSGIRVKDTRSRTGF